MDVLNRGGMRKRVSARDEMADIATLESTPLYHKTLMVPLMIFFIHTKANQQKVQEDIQSTQ